MERITPEGMGFANELAQRYGFSQDAVVHMMSAMLRGRGSMAQFNHPEFAGSGQWMAGGMLMVGDMFNHALKARVDGLCQAIHAALSTQSDLFRSGSYQSQTQGGYNQQMQVAGGAQPAPASQPPEAGTAFPRLFEPDPRDRWWPAELGEPTACGAQNEIRYASFGDSGRLAVDVNGQVTVYDTGRHSILGVSQQQGPGGSVMFLTPAGSVSAATLPTVGQGFQQQSSSGGGSGQQQQTGAASRQQSAREAAAQQQRSGAGFQEQQQSSGRPSTSFSGGGFAPMQPMAFQSMPAMSWSEPPCWWPPTWGSPQSSGAQNNLRYALFSTPPRLAVEVDGEVSLYDTSAHAVQSVSQQSGSDPLMVLTSAGPIPITALPRISADTPSGGPAPVTGEHSQASVTSAPSGASAPPSPGPGAEQDVMQALEKLAELKTKGILTEEEFTAKKAELLRRL